MRAGVIINPISGRGPGGAARAELARTVLARLGVEADVRVSDAPGRAVAIAREFVGAGLDLVVAWGGDGTANEVAGPLIGRSAALALVPAGSGDGLARGLGLPRRPDAALERAVRGPIGAMDVGYLGDRHFLNVAGIGFDAVVAQAFNRRTRRGVSGYVRIGLGGVWRYQSADYSVEIDGGASASGPRFIIAFANGTQYGRGLRIAPDADLTDGRLNAVIVSGGSPMRQIWRARRLGFRSLAPAEGVMRRTIERARVSGDHLVCHVDGEVFEASGVVDVRVVPGQIRLAGLDGRGSTGAGRRPGRYLPGGATGLEAG